MFYHIVVGGGGGSGVDVGGVGDVVGSDSGLVVMVVI